MLQIHDIKPIVQIPDYSIYLYYSLIFLSFLLTCVVLYFIYKFFQPKTKSQEMIWYDKLSNLDLNNTKQAAYDISKYGLLLAHDKRQIDLIEDLNNELSVYKYKKEIEQNFTENIKIKFNIFLETIDVK